MKVSKVDAPQCQGGEQPLWDHDGQALYYIDNFGQKLHRYEPDIDAVRSWDMPSVITAVALREGGGAIVTLRSGIHVLDFESGKLEAIAPLNDPPPFVYNDAKVDRRGRWLIGASTAQFETPTPDGGLFRLDSDHRLTKLDDGIHFSNGPCFSPDDRTFYFSDSWLKHCYAYDYDIETGELANRRIFADTTDLGGLPDGATIDSQGRLWIAIYSGGKIAAYTPDGKLDMIVEMPVKLVSSVMFGGRDLDQLYVTTIKHGPHGEPEEGAGYLYRIDGLGAQGLPEPKFAG